MSLKNSVNSPLFLFYEWKGRKIMREYLKKSGLAVVILVSIAAIAFLPKNISQWVVLGAILFFGVVKGVMYILNNEDCFAHKSEKLTARERNRAKNAPVVPLEFKYAVQQLSHRVTDKLHSAFPKSTWHWCEKPTARLFTDGGRVRIATIDTDNYNEADVILDTYGRIEIKMLETNTVSDIVKANNENAETEFTVDAREWYEKCAQNVLRDIITDLNARGTKVLCINEDGSLVVNEDEKVGMLKAFPDKNLWKKLTDIFSESGLTAVENEHSIKIGW